MSYLCVCLKAESEGAVSFEGVATQYGWISFCDQKHNRAGRWPGKVGVKRPAAVHPRTGCAPYKNAFGI